MKLKKYICITILIAMFALTISTISNATDLDSIYVWSNNTQNTVATSVLPESKNTGNFLNLTCGSAILIEQNTGTILYDHNMHEQLRPASVTKVMTILLIMEALDNRNNITRR